MSVSQLLYHGIFIFICPNMQCAMSVNSRLHTLKHLLRQQRGLKVVLAYVTNVLVKMNMLRTRYMLFCLTIGFVK
jgi:hypothetical protein